MPEPRVLLIAKDYPPSVGGAEIYNANVARSLVTLGHAVTVVTWTPGEETRGKTAPDQPTVIRLSDRRLRGPRPATQVRSALEEYQPDIAFVSPLSRHLTDVHNHLTDARIPTVAACHFFRSKHSRRAWIGRRKARRRLHLDRVDTVVTVSRYLAKHMRDLGVPREQLSIVPPGVDAQRFRRDSESGAALRASFQIGAEPVLLTVGRLVDGKGHCRVLSALTTLHEQGVAARYLIVGDGPTRTDLEQRAQQLGLEKHVRFAGEVDDPRPFYAAANVVVMPSGGEEWQEAFGITFVEAAAMELPVVASRGGGAEDIVVDGSTGHLIDPTDPDALVAAILSALDSGDTFGRAARDHIVERFTWQRSGEQLSALFRSVLAGGVRGNG